MPQSTTTTRRCRVWRPVDDDFIRSNWSTRSLSDIAAILDRSVSLTSKRAKLLGMPTKNPKWTKAEDAVLRRLYRTCPLKCVAKALERTVPQCVQRAGVLGLRSLKRGAAAHRGV